MLGPSGSGKTTTLRIVAGFEQPDSGRVVLRGADVTSRPPYARSVNTVFQDYALFPHMTVSENVEYGLRVKGVRRQERRRRAEDALSLVRLEGFGDRKPVQLSGRPAPAGRARPCDRQRARGAAPRRAARRARPEAASGDADRAEAHPAGGRDHVRLRDPRPGGGADDERPHRRVQPRPDRADRHPPRRLRAPGDRVRRRLRRHLEPALPRRPPVHDPPGEDPAARRGRAGGRAARRAGHDRRGRLRGNGHQLRRRRSTAAGRSSSSGRTRPARRPKDWPRSAAGGRSPRGTRTPPWQSRKRRERRNDAESSGATWRSRRSRRPALPASGTTAGEANGLPTATKGRGQARRDRVACLHRPQLREGVRGEDRLQDPAEGRRVVQPDGRPDAHRRRRRRRPVRPRLGLRRRQPPADLRRRRPGGEREPDPGLEELPPGVQVPAAQHRQGCALRRLAAVGAEHAPLQHEEDHPRRRRAGRRSTARSTRARSRCRTTRSRSPTRRCT